MKVLFVFAALIIVGQTAMAETEFGGVATYGLKDKQMLDFGPIESSGEAGQCVQVIDNTDSKIILSFKLMGDDKTIVSIRVNRNQDEVSNRTRGLFGRVAPNTTYRLIAQVDARPAEERAQDPEYHSGDLSNMWMSEVQQATLQDLRHIVTNVFAPGQRLVVAGTWALIKCDSIVPSLRLPEDTK